MLTWGLLRTNFSFDTDVLLLAARRRHQIVSDLLRDFGVVIEFHCVRCSASGPRAKVGRVTEHGGHRDKTGDGLYTRSGGNSSDFPPSGMQIAEHFSDVFIGG